MMHDAPVHAMPRFLANSFDHYRQIASISPHFTCGTDA
jgi:hypothetical protein